MSPARHAAICAELQRLHQAKQSKLLARIAELEAQKDIQVSDKLIDEGEIKRLIIEGAKEFELLGDWCVLIEYDPDVGRVPQRWEPRFDVFHAASYVVRKLYGIKENP